MEFLTYARRRCGEVEGQAGAGMGMGLAPFAGLITLSRACLGQYGSTCSNVINLREVISN